MKGSVCSDPQITTQFCRFICYFVGREIRSNEPIIGKMRSLMSDELPEARVNLTQALFKFGDAKLHEEWLDAKRRRLDAGGSSYGTLSWLEGGEIVSSSVIIHRRQLDRERDDAFRRFANSMWQRLACGELIAFGRKDRPDAPPARVEAALAYFRPDFPRNQIIGGGNVIYYDVTICHQEELPSKRKRTGRISDAKVVNFLVERDRAWNPEVDPRPTKEQLMQEAKQRFPELSETRFREIWSSSAPARLKRAGAPRKKGLENNASKRND